MTALCPHCGYDLRADEVIEAGALRFDPRGPVTWAGRGVPLRPAERAALWAILKAGGRTVTAEVVQARTGAAGRVSGVRVAVCRLRAKLTAAGAPDLIVTETGLGYRLAA